MDNVTRHFSIVTNRIREHLRTELRAATTAFKDESQKHIEAVHASDVNREKQHKITRKWLAKILAAHQKSETDRSENDRKANDVQNSIRYAAWLTFMSAFIYALIAMYQLQQMRIATETSIKAVRLAQESSDESASQFQRTMRQMVNQTIAQFRSAQGIQRSAANAKSSLQYTEDSFRQEQRAWVGVSQFTFQGDELWLYISNTGKTPAFHVGEGMVNEQMCCDVLLTIKNPKKGDGFGVMENKGTLLPGPPLIWQQKVPPIDKSITPFQLPSTVRIYTGRIEYQDVYSRQHWTRFCIYERGGSGHLTFCQYGNDTDDAPEIYPPDGKVVKYP